MPYGRGYRMGGGFRGAYAAWPYIGRGRGGLPRCGYYFDNPAHYTSDYQGAAPAAADYDPGDLKNALNALKDRLSRIQATSSLLNELEYLEARISQMEKR